MKKRNHAAIGLAALAACLIATPAMAQKAGDWLVRFGPAAVLPNDDSGDVEPLDDLNFDTGVEVEDGYSLAVTITYMLKDNVGLELLGALPFEHDIKGEKDLDGVDIATVEHLPPTLAVTYFFQSDSNVRPYVGAGINYTTFVEEDVDSELDALVGGDADIELDDSVGLAVVGGVDVDINDNWYFNASLWYIDIETEAEVDTPNFAVDELEVDVDIDPWVVMLGVGTSF